MLDSFLLISRPFPSFWLESSSHCALKQGVQTLLGGHKLTEEKKHVTRFYQEEYQTALFFHHCACFKQNNIWIIPATFSSKSKTLKFDCSTIFRPSYERQKYKEHGRSKKHCPLFIQLHFTPPGQRLY